MSATSGWSSHALLLIIALAVTGCDGTTAPPFAPRLPTHFSILANASSVDEDGREVSCRIETLVTLENRVEALPGRVVYYATGGGDAYRYVEKGNGIAVQFWAHTHFADLQIHIIGADSIEIRSPGAETATERFWREFSVFPGRMQSADEVNQELARGTWTCRPMDTPPSSGEYYDVTGTAPGTWSLIGESSE